MTIPARISDQATLGWKLVPIEPTPEMIDAWASARADVPKESSDEESNALVCASDWSAMLAATPVTTPSPISDQAAGDPKWRAELSRIAEDYQPDGASQAILALEEMRQALRELLESTACDCGVACRDDGDGKCRYSTAPTTGSAPDGWISTADRLPDVKVGTEREFIVACRRASNGKTYVFAASYLNEMGLMFDDDDCPEDGRPTTGWFNERNDIEYDNAFQNVCDEGDEVTHWMPLPDAPALLAASMGGDKA